MEGFSQRTVQASYASDGSVINLASMEYEDLDNDEMVNLEKISDNNGFDKKWREPLMKQTWDKVKSNYE